MLLPATNDHVADSLTMMQQGKKIDPLLMIRGRMSHGVRAQIADGYHRACAAWYIDQNTDIPFQMATLKGNKVASRSPKPNADTGDQPSMG